VTINQKAQPGDPVARGAERKLVRSSSEVDADGPETGLIYAEFQESFGEAVEYVYAALVTTAIGNAGWEILKEGVKGIRVILRKQDEAFAKHLAEVAIRAKTGSQDVIKFDECTRESGHWSLTASSGKCTYRIRVPKDVTKEPVVSLDIE
jgi:hypothetical protein